MISEVTFARDFSSFWRIVAPTIEGFVRRLNSGLCDRDREPLTANTAPNRRAFVNEVAFEVFCNDVATLQRGELRSDPGEIPRIAIATAREASAKVAIDSNYQNELSSEECADVLEQALRLRQRLAPRGALELISLKPKFPGCGIVDTCRADVLVCNTLFEIKAGDRSFRSIDVKQLITYLALNNASRSYSIRRVGLVNPRVGVSTELDVDEFCFQVSGRDEGGLLGIIAYGISSGEISR